METDAIQEKNLQKFEENKNLHFFPHHFSCNIAISSHIYSFFLEITLFRMQPMQSFQEINTIAIFNQFRAHAILPAHTTYLYVTDL